MKRIHQHEKVFINSHIKPTQITNKDNQLTENYLQKHRNCLTESVKKYEFELRVIEAPYKSKFLFSLNKLK